jgi:tryptophan halogenase
MTSPEPQRLIVVGDGVAGAMAAAAFASALPSHLYAVHLVPCGTRDDSVGIMMPVQTGRPGLRQFHHDLGINEDQLVRAAGASFSLGTAWSGCSPVRTTYFLPFAGAGAALDGVAFHQLVARLRAESRAVRMGDFAPAALMAQAGRFAPPPADPRNPLSTVDYTMHLPPGGHRAALLSAARKHGARHEQAGFQGVEIGADGMIEAIVLNDGMRLDGSLFIDASGSRAVLASALPGAGFESWRQWLPCDRAITAGQATDVPPAPYAHVEAHAAGWRLTAPAQEQVGQLLDYCSDFMSDEQASLMLPAGGDPQHIEAGRRTQPWSGNCVAIGAAAAMIDPHHGLGLHLVQTAIERLLRLLPRSLPAEPEAREYNRQTIDELDRARDLAIVSFVLSGRSEPFWKSLKKAALPEELAAKIDLYRSRGRVPLLDGDLLDEPELALLLDELGIRARRYDALADIAPVERLERQLARMRELMIDAIRPLPLHGDYIAQIRAKAAA